jgi:hypothetical protein
MRRKTIIGKSLIVVVNVHQYTGLKDDQEAFSK